MAQCSRVVAAALALSWLLALWQPVESIQCQANSNAEDALQSDANVTVNKVNGVGYTFDSHSGTPTGRGVLILPSEDVAYEAYAPLAHALAKDGSYAVVVEKPDAGATLQAMMGKPELEHWVVAGHGRGGGAMAAKVAVSLQPRVKALVLMAAPMPEDVDMTKSNLLVMAMYGNNDTIVMPAAVKESFSRFPGDASTNRLFWGTGHYDFAESECVGNQASSKQDGEKMKKRFDLTFQIIVSNVKSAVKLSQWYKTSEKALSFSDNERLTPGRNNSKVYPGDIHVQFSEIPVPNSNPQRFWWVFTPTTIKGGVIYYPGGSVDGRAYFPLAFEIAARGHVVVIVQMRSRLPFSTNILDASVIMASENPLLSVVPKGKWALSGHSVGGVGALIFANIAFVGEKVYAIVMHAGGWTFNTTNNPLPIAQIYGTLDDISPGGYDRYRYLYTDPPPKGNGPLVNLNTTVFIPVQGATHYQVGDYGYQSPDDIPTISMEQQVSIFANLTVEFLDDVLAKNINVRNTQHVGNM